MTGLGSLLRNFQGNVAALRQIYRAFGAQPQFLTDAAAALRQLDPDDAWRAAWLLDHAARDGRVDDLLLAKIVPSLDEQTHWAARGCLCHVFSVTGCPPSLRAAVFPFLEDCFRDSHDAISCWALTAALKFADDRAYAPVIAAMVTQARRNKGKAMQARLRQLGLLPYPLRRPKPRKASGALGRRRLPASARRRAS